MTDHPTTPATDHPTINGRPVAPTTDRHRPVDWSGLRGRLSRWGNPTTDRALRLAAEHLADQATRPRRRRWFGRRPAAAGQATRPARRPRKTPTQRLDEVYAHLVLAAPLVVAGWFQAHAINFLLAAPWVVAIGFTTAWEGGAGYCARLYVRALLRRDSTIVLRLGMLTFAGVSCGLLWLELHMQERPPWLAAAVGALVTSGIFLWCRRARDLHRDALHADGMVDAAVVRFSFAAWIAAPLETPAAMRYAIKHRISHPVEAIEAYRADRKRRRIMKALACARKAARDRTAKAVDRTEPTVLVPVEPTTDQAEVVDPTAVPVESLAADRAATSAAVDQTQEPTTGHRPTGHTVDWGVGARRHFDQTLLPCLSRPVLVVDSKPEKPADPPPPNLPTVRKRSTGRRRTLHVVGEPAAVGNARLLRERYPTGLPDIMRQIRTDTGWSKDRVDAAVDAYRAGRDQATEAEENTA